MQHASAERASHIRQNRLVLPFLVAGLDDWWHTLHLQHFLAASESQTAQELIVLPSSTEVSLMPDFNAENVSGRQSERSGRHLGIGPCQVIAEDVQLAGSKQKAFPSSTENQHFDLQSRNF